MPAARCFVGSFEDPAARLRKRARNPLPVGVQPASEIHPAKYRPDALDQPAGIAYTPRDPSEFAGSQASMPSFDVVSEINRHELSNALDQTNREVSTRFDFKGSNARVETKELLLTLIAPSDFQVQQLLDVLKAKLARRGIDLASLKIDDVVVSGSEARQLVTVREGLDSDFARKLVKLIKESGLKVQAQIQEKQVRVTGKKRDDLQAVIAMLRAAKLELPLQFTNFRD
jgi:cyclic-di-GMP-binding protein